MLSVTIEASNDLNANVDRVAQSGGQVDARAPYATIAHFMIVESCILRS